MKTFLLVCLTVGLLTLAGCGKEKPILAGGKPVSYWIEALRDPDAKVRKQAVQKLGNVGSSDPASPPALVGALQDRDAGVRREAILALMKCGPEVPESIPALNEMQKRDPDAKVRSYAGKALEKLKE